MERPVSQLIDYKYTNNYLQLPIMASFSFGSEKLRGFCNLGVYGGYWLNSSRKGREMNTTSWKAYDFSEKMKFNGERDRRWVWWTMHSRIMASISATICSTMALPTFT